MRKAAPVLLFMLLACGQAFAQGKEGPESEMRGLVIRGEVTGLEVERAGNSVIFHANLNVEFVNEGTETIILFGPSIGGSTADPRVHYWLGGWALYVSEEEAKNGRAVFGDGYWESVMGSDYYRDLAYSLDVKTPPSLTPNSSARKSPGSFPTRSGFISRPRSTSVCRNVKRGVRCKATRRNSG